MSGIKGTAPSIGILKQSVSQFGAQTTIDIINKNVFDEIVFSISKRLLIGASGVIDIVFDPTACTCAKLPFLPVALKFFGAGPIFIDLYINPIYTVGTPILAINRDFTSSNTSKTIWLINPTISNLGFLSPAEFIVLSNGTSANAAAGGESKESQLSNIDITKKYLFRMTNQEAKQAQGHIASTWSEES